MAVTGLKSTGVSDFEYALRILAPSPFAENYDKALARFRREIKALRSLQHRAIILKDVSLKLSKGTVQRALEG